MNAQVKEAPREQSLETSSQHPRFLLLPTWCTAWRPLGVLEWLRWPNLESPEEANRLSICTLCFKDGLGHFICLLTLSCFLCDLDLISSLSPIPTPISSHTPILFLASLSCYED